jgi:DNA-binding winged helix-turn-helix (wHTH) protein/Tol biopolymer transport system component
MSPDDGQSFEFGEFRLDVAEKSLHRRGAQLPLTPKVFDTLQILVVNAGHLVEKETLMDSIWPGRYVEESNLTHNIKVLRKTLGDEATSPRFIETVPRRGYRFIADVSRSSEMKPDERIVLESVMRATVSTPYTLIGLTGILVLSLFVLAFVWLQARPRKGFVNGKDRITNIGKVSLAAVAPDGGSMVFAQQEAAGESLWKLQLTGGELTQLVPPSQVEFVGLSITPAGDFAYYTTFAENNVDLSLSRISLAGGTPETLPVESDVSVSFSPDGKRFAYTEAHSAVHQTLLKVANTDGTDQKILLTAEGEKRVLPVFQSSPVSWSLDGTEIACAVQEAEGNEIGFRILLVDPEDGSERYLSDKRWEYVAGIVWKDQETLALINIDPNFPGTQTWLVSRRTGEARQLASDTNDYGWLSAANGKLFAVRKVLYSSLYIIDFDRDLEAPRTKQVFNEHGSIDCIDWLGDKIYYNSQATGKNEIWRIDVAGTSAHQVTDGSNLTFWFSASPADGSIVFSAAQKQGNYLFLADPDGRNVRQLTSGVNDSSPRFTPDGKEVIYQQGSMIKPTLWRVSPDGSRPPEQVTGYHALQPSVSPDGKTIAYHFMDFVNGGRVWRLGLMDRETGRLKQKLDFPKLVTERKTVWRPGDDLLTMTFGDGNRYGFLFLRPDGTGYRQVDNLTNDRISSFVWSPDGARLAFAAIQESSDAIVLDP